jgi:hypothetical protein
MNQKGTAAPWRRSMAGTTHGRFTAHCYRNPEYLSRLLSHLQRKTGGEIAYLHDQQRQGLQKFIGDVGPGYEPASRARPRIPIRSDISEISATANCQN